MKTDLVVAVCTLDRPIGLRTLLGELISQADDVYSNVEILVIDNSRDASASWVSTEPPMTERVSYVHCKERGLSNARNVALEYTSHFPAPLAFIDDDEFPSGTWLKTALSGLSNFEGDILAGPVKPWLEPTEFKNLLPIKFWERPSREDEAIVLDTVGNGNVVFPSKLVLSGIRYAKQFNLTGGEDTDFILRSQRQGFKIRNLNNLSVTETVTASRQSLEYLTHKASSSSSSWVRVMKANGSHPLGFIPSLAKHTVFGILKSIAWVATRKFDYFASAKIHGAMVKGTLNGLRGSSIDRQEKYQSE